MGGQRTTQKSWRKTRISRTSSSPQLQFPRNVVINPDLLSDSLAGKHIVTKHPKAGLERIL